MKVQVLHLAKHYHPAHGGMETATKDLAETGIGLGLAVRCLAFGTKENAGRYQVGGVEVRAYAPLATIRSAPLHPALLSARLRDGAVLHLHLPNPLMEARLLLSLLFSSSARRRCIPFFHAFPLRQGRLGRIWFQLVTTPILALSPRILVSDLRIVDCFPPLHRWRDKCLEMPFATDPLEEAEWEGLKESRVGARTVLAVGRLVGYKGFDVLLAAWRVIEDNPSFEGFRLRIVGDGPEAGPLRALSQKLRLERVSFTGAVAEEEKRKHLRESFLLAAPSLTRAETFGISVLEAMAYGLAVATTNLPTGLRTLAREGACGAADDPGNVAQLAESLARLLRDPRHTLENFGHANLRFVRERYSREGLKAKYRALLRSLGIDA